MFKNNNGNDHIYYDLKINNNSITDKKEPLVFHETRQQPIIDNASDWYLSIIRFQLETSSLPIFIPQLKLGTSNPNELVYQIQLDKNGDNITSSVQYIPTNTTIMPPTNLSSTDNFSNEYYFVYTFTKWCDMLNATVATVYNNLQNHDQTPPYFSFDASSGLMSLHCNIKSSNDFSAGLKIRVNAPLNSLIGGFNFSKISDGDYMYEFVLPNSPQQLDLYNVEPSKTYNCVIQQDYPTLAICNPISSIIFTTSLLPINPSQQNSPQILNTQNNDISLTGVSNDYRLTLNDFQVYVEKGTEYKPNIQYNAGAEYKLIDMYGNNSISNIDLSCYWLDVYNEAHPFFLEAQNCASVQILFRRKSY